MQQEASHNNSHSDVRSVDVDAVTVEGGSGSLEKAGADKEEAVQADAEKAAPAPPAFNVPDGGWEAWSVVAGGWFALFSTFGYVNAFGVYQAYYVEKLGRSDSAVSWIGSFQLWLMFTMGLFTGKLFDEGHCRLLIFVGSVFYIVALFMTSLCTEYWQVFLAQGVCGGIGLGILFLPALSVVPQWFQKRRAFATGVVTTGSSVGGVVFPIMLNHLFNSVGYAKGVRASAYIILGCLVLVNLLIKPRIPGRSKRPAHMQFPAPDMKSILTHDAYWATIGGGFLIMWGLFFPLFYIQVFAQSHGVNENLSFYLLSILNATSIFGRTLPNLLADKFGVMNMLIGAAFCAGVLNFVWLACTSEGASIVFSILYGFFSGAYVSIMPGVIASLSSHIGEVGVRMGFAWSIIALAALTGTPIDGYVHGS
ncbi:MFS general substrate transporter [Punctularia strigosozonata HHB-11173 SS5]|uniref:MFS general substrate transporter n=1 Tax=Punctularia strigosozonata (strain HHB-11173) TaxID=741275 RepID=UPI00044185AD|nr:MFS general substrate transporter [Punctularia strigosozonata HHB-11173 SS5]EIN11718.1 MFS general substrate transporter [Punctularia strigosozonata HHB-11173 SS5]